MSPLDHEFSPVPSAAREALAERRLDCLDLAILFVIYDLAKDRYRASMTLDKLVEAVAWEGSRNGLYKRLCKLRGQGWLRWTTTPGQARAVYRFELPHGSELAQSLAGDGAQSSAEPQTGAAPRDRARSAADRSEQDEAEVVAGAQSRPHSAQSSEQPSTPRQEPDCAPSVEVVAQSSQEGERKGSALEGGLVASSLNDPGLATPPPEGPSWFQERAATARRRVDPESEQESAA